MTYGVYIVFEDDKRDLAEEFGRLDEAIVFALKLADDIGQGQVDDRHAPQKSVDIYRGTALDISIRVMRGGLLGRKGAPK